MRFISVAAGSGDRRKVSRDAGLLLSALLVSTLAVVPQAGAQPLPGIASGPARDYLLAARSALLRGRLLDARDDLERAETRLLDRSLVATRAAPDMGRAVLDIAVARQAVAGRQAQVALRAIDDALRQVRLQAELPATVASSAPIILQSPSAPPTSSMQLGDRSSPPVTYALFPGRWELSGATYSWVPPDQIPRPVQARPYVSGQYEWRGGAWVWNPTHFGGS